MMKKSLLASIFCLAVAQQVAASDAAVSGKYMSNDANKAAAAGAVVGGAGAIGTVPQQALLLV